MTQEFREKVAFFMMLGILSVPERSAFSNLVKQAEQARYNAEVDVQRRVFFLGEARKIEGEVRYFIMHTSYGVF